MTDRKNSVKDFHLRVLQHLDNDVESIINVFRAIYEAATEMEMTDIETLDGELLETMLSRDANKKAETHKRVLGMKIKFLKLQDVEELLEVLAEELSSVATEEEDAEGVIEDLTGESPAIAINGSRKIH